MKFIQTPGAEAIISASKTEVENFRKMGGLWLPTKFRDGKNAYFWRSNGTWLIVVEDQEHKVKEGWKTNSASQKQLDLMDKHGIEYWDEITKGEASDLIDAYFKRKRV